MGPVENKFFQKERAMKILVIDDSPVHQAAAKKQLTEHDLAVVGSYDEAVRLLEPHISASGRWDRGECPKHGFDVVLTDLLMPASGMLQGEGRKFVGQEMPVGIFLALLAAKNGAKHVAVFTDSDHHDHPASACFDPFNEGKYMSVALPVAGAQVILVNNPNLVQTDTSIQPEEVEKERLDGSKYKLQIYPRIKRWDLALRNLLNPPQMPEEEVGIA